MAAANLDPQFLSLMNGLSVPETFQKLMAVKKVADAHGFALLALEEKDVKDTIFAIAKTGNAELTEICDQLAVKKLWVACRKIFNQADSGSFVGSPSNEEGMPQEPETDVKSHWKAVQGFVLPDCWLLSAHLQGKL